MEPALGLSRGRHPGLSAGCRLPTCEVGIHGVRLLKDGVGEAFKREPCLLSLLALVLPVDRPRLGICSASRES